jgi:hypothetical protein
LPRPLTFAIPETAPGSTRPFNRACAPVMGAQTLIRYRHSRAKTNAKHIFEIIGKNAIDPS